MPKGPNGERRPADAVGLAVMVGRIATGEEVDTAYVSKNRRKSGVAGAEARMGTVDAGRRSEIATKAATARWSKEATMNVTDQLTRLYETKRAAGLVDVKFLHKNLDEGSPTQVQADLLKIHKAIAGGKVSALDFGDLRWKKSN